jgi:hypothetical protein
MSFEKPDITAVSSGASTYSIAAFAAFRLDNEVGEDIALRSARSINETLNNLALHEDRSAFHLVNQFNERLRRPFAFLCNLFMELHHVDAGERRSSSDLGKLDESQIGILIDEAVNSAIAALDNSPVSTKTPSTVPFRCVEDHKQCKKNNNQNVKLCHAALVICLLQCVVPMARGAGGSQKAHSDDDNVDSDIT